MDRQDQERHEVGRIMRRAADLGHDPRRVARALGYGPPPRVEYQPVERVVRRFRPSGALSRLRRRS